MCGKVARMSDEQRSSGKVNPGWFPDPHDVNKLRYWDGGRWTEHSAPVPSATAPPGAAIVDKHRRGAGTTRYVVGAIVGFLAWVSFFGSTPAEAERRAPDLYPVVPDIGLILLIGCIVTLIVKRSRRRRDQQKG